MKITCFNCLGDGVLFDEGQECRCKACDGTGQTDLTHARIQVLVQKFESDVSKFVSSHPVDDQTVEWILQTVSLFNEPTVEGQAR